jgi:hydroxymethylpyrimidine/phosphomethylpyrimidine kinase
LIDSLPENIWSDFIDHKFVRGIADGTLKRESFEHFIKQDYLYLQNYARAAALAAYKSKKVYGCRRNCHNFLNALHYSQRY